MLRVRLYYENNHDVFITIVMVMLPFYNNGCVILTSNTMKNSALVAHFSLLKCVPTRPVESYVKVIRLIFNDCS